LKEAKVTKLLVIDTETGGLDPLNHSLLSWAGVVWEDSKLTSEMEVFVKEDPITATLEAMEINRIDLRTHHERALPPGVAMRRISTFVTNNFSVSEKVVLVGHNVTHDIGFTKRLFRMTHPERYDQLFSHRSLDTASILRFLFLLGLVPESATSSTGGFKHFGIEVPAGERHTALGDARATALLLTRMMELVVRRVEKDQQFGLFTGKD
jgi:DNA polymerase-3 subunit epsilon